MTKLLLAKPATEEIYQNLLERVARLKEQGIVPKLTVVLIGGDARSKVYVKSKVATGKDLGVLVDVLELDSKISQQEITEQIKSLVQDKNVHGIIIQLPVPEHLDIDKLLNLIPPQKDVDGLTKKAVFMPATALGVVELIKFYNLPIKGEVYAIFGQGRLAGRPLANLLKKLGAKVIVIDLDTQDFKSKIKLANIIISAVGKPEFLTKDLLGKRLAIIDIGLSSVGGKLVGDIAQDAKDLAKYATPVIGGVGPMTVAGLMINTVKAAELVSEKTKL